MNTDSVLDVELIIGLVLVAAVLAGLADKLDLPYPVVLLVGARVRARARLAIAPPQAGPRVLDLSAAGLLGCAAVLHAALRANARPIGMLAIGLNAHRAFLGVTLAAGAITGAVVVSVQP